MECRFRNSLIGMFNFWSPNSRGSYVKLCLSVSLSLSVTHTHTHTHTHRVCLCFFVFCIDQPHVWEEMWNGAEVAVTVKWERGPGFGPWWGYRPYSHVGAPSPRARAAGISLLFVNLCSCISALCPSWEAIAACISLLFVNLCSCISALCPSWEAIAACICVQHSRVQK